MNGRRVPDIYQDVYQHAVEAGLSHEAAAWHADLALLQLGELDACQDHNTNQEELFK